MKTGVRFSSASSVGQKPGSGSATGLVTKEVVRKTPANKTPTQMLRAKMEDRLVELGMSRRTEPSLIFGRNSEPLQREKSVIDEEHLLNMQALELKCMTSCELRHDDDVDDEKLDDERNENIDANSREQGRVDANDANDDKTSSDDDKEIQHGSESEKLDEVNNNDSGELDAELSKVKVIDKIEFETCFGIESFLKEKTKHFESDAATACVNNEPEYGVKGSPLSESDIEGSSESQDLEVNVINDGQVEFRYILGVVIH